MLDQQIGPIVLSFPPVVAMGAAGWGGGSFDGAMGVGWWQWCVHAVVVVAWT